MSSRGCALCTHPFLTGVSCVWVCARAREIIDTYRQIRRSRRHMQIRAAVPYRRTWLAYKILCESRKEILFMLLRAASRHWGWMDATELRRKRVKDRNLITLFDVCVANNINWTEWLTHSRIHPVQSRQLHLRLTRHFVLSSCYVTAHLCVQRALRAMCVPCMTGEESVSLRVSNTNRELHRKEIIFPSLLIHRMQTNLFFSPCAILAWDTTAACLITTCPFVGNQWFMNSIFFHTPSPVFHSRSMSQNKYWTTQCAHFDSHVFLASDYCCCPSVRRRLLYPWILLISDRPRSVL